MSAAETGRQAELCATAAAVNGLHLTMPPLLLESVFFVRRLSEANGGTEEEKPRGRNKGRDRGKNRELKETKEEWMKGAMKGGTQARRQPRSFLTEEGQCPGR